MNIGKKWTPEEETCLLNELASHMTILEIYTEGQRELFRHDLAELPWDSIATECPWRK